MPHFLHSVMEETGVIVRGGVGASLTDRKKRSPVFCWMIRLRKKFGVGNFLRKKVLSVLVETNYGANANQIYFAIRIPSLVWYCEKKQKHNNLF